MAFKDGCSECVKFYLQVGPVWTQVWPVFIVVLFSACLPTYIHLDPSYFHKHDIPITHWWSCGKVSNTWTTDELDKWKCPEVKIKVMVISHSCECDTGIPGTLRRNFKTAVISLNMLYITHTINNYFWLWFNQLCIRIKWSDKILYPQYERSTSV